MKILAIRIRNLASLEGNTEINFTAEPLCSAGIFAITGATGAGKSTILDALCLALYGKTPRYLQARETGIEIRDVQGSTLSQGDVRSILRDGTADGFAEVDFRGTDGLHYRAKWSVRRARNKAEGSMQSDSVTLTNLTLASEVPGKKQETLNEIARLIGLNFDQFTRSVLLAQGDFTAFMKAGRDEKASLLEKLTGTHVYSEISRKIYEKHKYEEQLLRELDLRKDGITTFTKEELQELQSERQIVEQQIGTLEKEAASLTEEITWHRDLTKLLTYLDEADRAFRQAGENSAAALPRKEKLSIAEQVQQTRSTADTLNRTKQLLQEKTDALGLLKEAIATRQKDREKLESQLSASENSFLEKSHALNDALPLLGQARRLDILLAERKEQTRISSREAETAAENHRQYRQSLEDKQKEAAGLSEQLAAISGWQKDHADRSAIAENRDLILSKLRDAGKSLDLIRTTTSGQSEVKSRTEAAQTEKETVEKEWKQQREYLNQLQKSYTLREELQTAVPASLLEKEKADADLEFEALLKAQTLWQAVYSLSQETDAVNLKLEKDQLEYRAKKKLYEELDRQIPLEKERKETAAKIVTQARLASAESVETLRSGLMDDEPCPVCGSTTHPYAIHNPQLEHVLSRLEKAYEEQEKQYLSLYRSYNTTEQECRNLEQVISGQTEELAQKRAVLEKKKQDWMQLPAAQECHQLTDRHIPEWLDGKLAALNAERKVLASRIDTLSIEKQQLERDRKEIENLKETTTGLSDRIRDLAAHLALLQERDNHLTKEYGKAASELKETELNLSPYFTASAWMEHWKKDPGAFTERIERFAGQWKDNTERKEQLTREKLALEATVKEMENQEKSGLAEMAQKQLTHKKHLQDFLEIQEQRNLLFEGQPADAVETMLRQTAADALKQSDLLRESLQNILLETARLHTKQEEIEATLMTAGKEAENALGQLESWLNGYNRKNGTPLTIQQLYELLNLSHEWRETERIFLRSVEEEVTRAESIVTERKQALTGHQEKRLSGRNAEELDDLLTAVKADTEQKKHKKGEISFRMQQDAENRSRIGDLLKSIEAQALIAENWSRLNEMIGSADGKKFRQMAQEYTLDALLGYANVHLQSLTGRYRIERIPSSLGLQVVDGDMGDEVRTVYSLSGGESFLVSLALALGLASLSSNRMKVESLFIDEGFGSLDPNTLNIAMDALERLHNQGRKVGVISHVQEMTERIPVQIRVSKKQSGKSKVEVTGH